MTAVGKSCIILNHTARAGNCHSDLLNMEGVISVKASCYKPEAAGTETLNGIEKGEAPYLQLVAEHHMVPKPKTA